MKYFLKSVTGEGSKVKITPGGVGWKDPSNSLTDQNNYHDYKL
jgi:hypothetical protein